MLRDLDTDRITDFRRGQDKIGLDKQSFSELSAPGFRLKASEFVSVANDSLVDRSSALIVFSRATGRVFYNSNDTETNSYPDPIKFAKLVGITHLSAADFTLI